MIKSLAVSRTFNLKLAALALASLSLAGCGGTISGAGPYKGAIESKTEAYTLVDIDAKTIAPYMRGAVPPVLATVTKPVPPEVRLMAGDTLNVLIADTAPEGSSLFAPLATGGTQLKSRIDSEGKLSLPYVGRQFVAGMTLNQVENMIHRQLKGITTDVQTHVELVGDLSGSVLVAGAVKTPGRFSTLQGPLTLLDAVNQAGGPVLEPHLVNVTVRNGSQVQQFNYEEVLAGNNMVLRPNSEVVLDRARQRFVAMGAVTSPGLKDLPDRNTSLLDALGSVGGLREGSANAEGVFVFRMEAGKPKPVVLRLNMRDPAAIFYARQVMVKPDDTIYVTNAAVYEWQKVISPIVQTMVLGRATGVN
ncbi:polysaccharide biosynthesis/export family protein [Pseudomonas kermanshahensis]|uniref:Polysaccharide biosynthesis/export family protein n=1 Tax=Pseudomonas kermanshahensis TaxID=2745482 RepID=A0ABU8R9K0_9PSED|nr:MULTISPECIES: polysaccharide biosynthesis/export family protein [unclassified Pseudomonas]MBC3486193.1 polysaccharide biosynthesis/export family protein [Pseudomonas sp. SWRI50]SMF45741.1 polysaccharide export outer membrane protein [Pseudomonas sp. LAIL14HWK12:I11]SMR79591.1 polysaccharide export outer membrane protein [Pseudomonas sp. LAIL14HWK12:I10]SOD05661.1 polysaccharide export outer membrane protein [Pseudomonas sp. LAIL14HWK12:I8]